MHEISFKDISIIKSGGAIDSTKLTSKSSHDINQNTVTKLNTTKKSLKHATKSAQEAAKAPFRPSSTQMSVKNTSWKKSIAESNMVPQENERTTLFSTWTPLSDEKTNNKLFEERKQLCLKWFETWNDRQRSMAIEDLLYTCKPKQLFHTRDTLNKISPVYHLDFTRMLPRVVCLYIMSFLDPRSLSRCSQVCWYWKMLSEGDQLWMPKCLRFGWNLNYIPSSFESGIWKQFYIENIKSLQYIPLAKMNTPIPTERSEVTLKDISNGRFGFSKFAQTSQRMPKNFKSSKLKQPPWKANNSNPNHLYRYNYLDTCEGAQAKKNELVKKMKSITIDNIKNQNASIVDSSTKTFDATVPDQQIIENLISKGNSLINQLSNPARLESNATFAEKFEKSFKLPNFADDDESLNNAPDLFALHRQANLTTENLQNKPTDLLSKKQAWTLLDS